MITINNLYSEGTRVVLGINQSVPQLTGLEPIEITKNNVGTILKGEKCKYGGFDYVVLLDNGEKLELHTTTSLTDCGSTIKIEPIENTLRYNQEKLEMFLKEIELIRKNLEYLSTVELNSKDKKQENYDIQINEQEKRERKAYAKAAELRKEILACKNKQEAISLVERKRYSKHDLQQIGFSLNIMLWQEDIKSKMISDFVTTIFERNKNK